MSFLQNTWAGLISCRKNRTAESQWTAVASWDFTPEGICHKPPSHYQKLNPNLKVKMKQIMSKNCFVLVYGNITTQHLND